MPRARRHCPQAVLLMLPSGSRLPGTQLPPGFPSCLCLVATTAPHVLALAPLPAAAVALAPAGASAQRRFQVRAAIASWLDGG